MPRKLAVLVLLACGVVLAAAPTASAHGPPIDPAKPSAAQLRAQARAIGDVGVELRRELKPLRRQILRRVYKRLERCLVRAGLDEPEPGTAVPGAAFELITVSAYSELGAGYAPLIRRFAARFEALGSDDPIVAAGIAAWARLSAALDRLAAARVFSCDDLVAWARGGFRAKDKPRAPSVRERDLLALFFAAPAHERAELRLLQLGVTSRAARGFGFPDFFGLESALEEEGEGEFEGEEIE